MNIQNLLWFWELNIGTDARLTIISLSCLFILCLGFYLGTKRRYYSLLALSIGSLATVLFALLCISVWDVNPYASAYLSWLQPGVFTDLTEEGPVAFYVFYFKVNFIRLVGHFVLWTIISFGAILAQKTMRRSRAR
jgi:hypothetical protein